jgi:hypothetical protein
VVGPPGCDEGNSHASEKGIRNTRKEKKKQGRNKIEKGRNKIEQRRNKIERGRIIR